MAASFAGATFLEAPSGDGYASWDKRMLTLTRQRVGDEATVSHIGLDVQRATIAGLVTAAELAALWGQVGESGSLVMDWETHDAVLESIDPPLRAEVGGDLFQITMHFIRL